ncbi:hypothetical protein D9619_009877 [Psilocybe cf. subviscida]|uniref:No apical meristem-associated C-terminal domain-containing protein n=1 Tax=Psilocybe cf. subviscida TaxID=2480587 RepID=A0A8H5BLI0_9AGAR|nr:hypothetical protein D9619_009877 [Psilocybe cf. subviscida]
MRLHVFWRTLPYYNQFASKSVDDNGKLKSPNDNGKPKSSNFGTPMKRKRGTKEIESDSSDDAVEVNMSTTAPKKKRTQRTVAEESAPRKAKAHTPETDEDEIDEVMQAHRASSTKLSADQLFQIKMAELRYKTQKEENIARQQEQTQKVLMALLDSMKR